MKQDAAFAFSFIGERTSYRKLACANPHSLVTASREQHFKKALNQADILLPNGSGIVLAALLMQQIEARLFAELECHFDKAGHQKDAE